MIRHMFKLIWNQKKQNFLLITEILVSFMVIFAVFTLLVFFYKNYKKPMGMEYENVWAIRFDSPEKIKTNDSLALFYETIGNLLKTIPEIRSASFTSGNYPFSPSTNNSLVTYGKKSAMANFFTAQDHYADVLNLKITEGRWFNKTDNASKYKAVVINEMLKKELFNNEDPIGKKLGEGSDASEVVGVVQDIKDKGDYQPLKNGIFRRMDSTMYFLVSSIIINVSPGVNAGFETKLFKTLSNAIGANIEIRHLTSQKEATNKITLIPMIILFIVAGFLVINVALGLFGVLWYNINKRKSEIGLRRAVGASGGLISTQFVGEALVLSTFSLIVGSFFAIQFPLLNVFDVAAGTYLIAMAMAIAFIYLLVIACAFYPGKQAAAIYPAVALHED
ncbi:MAG: ABC transporter permease [Bacteroidota bacterium]